MLLNPYLFLLLKKIITTEVEIEVKKLEPSISDIVDKIVGEKTRKHSSGIVNKIKLIWSLKEFVVAEHYLDIMARYPKRFIKYDSWNDFKTKEGKNAFADVGEVLSGKPYISLPINEQHLIDRLSSRRVSDIILGVSISNSNYNEIMTNFKNKIGLEIKDARGGHYIFRDYRYGGYNYGMIASTMYLEGENLYIVMSKSGKAVRRLFRFHRLKNRAFHHHKSIFLP